MTDEMTKITTDKVQLTGMDPWQPYWDFMREWAEEFVAFSSCDKPGSALFGILVGDCTWSDTHYVKLAVANVINYASTKLVRDGLFTAYEVAALSTFGRQKYARHPLSPNSWVELPARAFLEPMLRHLGEAGRGTPHVEIISQSDVDRASLPEHLGKRYEGRHEAAVVWSGIRCLHQIDEGKL